MPHTVTVLSHNCLESTLFVWMSRSRNGKFWRSSPWSISRRCCALGWTSTCLPLACSWVAPFLPGVKARCRWSQDRINAVQENQSSVLNFASPSYLLIPSESTLAGFSAHSCHSHSLVDLFSLPVSLVSCHIHSMWGRCTTTQSYCIASQLDLTTYWGQR